MKKILEIGLEIDTVQVILLEKYLQSNDIPYYIEPERVSPWYSLEELEAACEGK